MYRVFAIANTVFSLALISTLLPLLISSFGWRDFQGSVITLALAILVIMSVVAVWKVARNNGVVSKTWKILSFGSLAVFFIGMLDGGVEDSMLIYGAYLLKNLIW